MRVLELQKYSFNNDLLVRDIGEIRMVYNRNNGDMYELSEMGKEVFSYLERLVPIASIVDEFVQVYDAAREMIELDVEEFVTRMIELGVVILSQEDRTSIFQLEYVECFDTQEYMDVRTAVGWESISMAQAKSSIENSFAVVGCRCNKTLVACARVMWDGGYTAFIVDVMVRPEWQRQGIGSHMMEKLINKLDCQLNAREKMMVNLYSSAGKEEFYEKFGFMKGTGMVRWIRKE